MFSVSGTSVRNIATKFEYALTTRDYGAFCTLVLIGLVTLTFSRKPR